MKDRKKKIYFLAVLMLTFIFTDCRQVKASESVQLQGYSYWEDQGKDVEIEEPQPGNVHIRIDAAPIKEDYGYSVMTGTFLEGMAGSGFRVNLKAESGGTAYLMFQLQDQNGNLVRLKENALVIKEQKQQIDVLAQGQLKIEGVLSETFTVPFDSFESSETFDWNHIINYSMGITQEKGSVLTLEADGFSWYGTKEVIPGQSALASIAGQSEMELPVHGEAIGLYTVDNPDYQFKVIQEEGISFDETGKLTVTTQAAAQELVLEAENKEGMTIRKEVSLVLPLRSTVNYISTFPAPEEIGKIHIFMEQADNDALLNGLRAAGILAVLAVLTAFCYYHSKRKGK